MNKKGETFVFTGAEVADPKPIASTKARLYVEQGSGCIKAVYFQKDHFMGQVLKIGNGSYYEQYFHQFHDVKDVIFVLEITGNNDYLPFVGTLNNNLISLQNSGSDFVKVTDNSYRGIVFKNAEVAKKLLSRSDALRVIASFGMEISTEDLLKIITQFD